MTEGEKDDLALALQTTNQIVGKVRKLLDPLEREMSIGGWSREYRAIMWDAVAMEARRRSATFQR